jgi:hypothetical protein
VTGYSEGIFRARPFKPFSQLRPKLPELVEPVISSRCENSSHSGRVLFCQKLPIQLPPELPPA